MLTNNTVSLLAKNGGSMATKRAKQVVKNKAVGTAIDEVRDAFVAALAPFVIENGKVVIERGKATLRRPFANRKNRGMAVDLAGQIVGGTYEQGRHRS